MSKDKELKILVIGASGFIGCHLVRRLLDENIHVRVLIRPNSHRVRRLDGLDVDIFHGDMSDPEALHKATEGMYAVVNAGRANSTTDWNLIEKINVRGTSFLIEAAIANNVQKVVHISDIEVYDLLNVKKGTSVNEHTSYHKNPKKMGAYTYSAVEREKLLLSAFERHGLCTTIIRPGIVIGPYGYVFFPHLGYRLKENTFVYIGKGDNILPLTYVENTVDGIFNALFEGKAAGQVYNIVDDGKITVKGYLELFAKVTGKNMRIISIPYAIPYLATTAYGLVACVGLVKKGVTSRDQFKWKHVPMVFDNTKAKNEIGWEPRIPIKEGLIKTFNWFADQ